MLDYLSSKSFAGNNLIDYAIALLLFIATLVVISILQKIAVVYIKRLEKRASADMISLSVKSFRKRLLPITYTLAIYVGLNVLSIPAKSLKIINNIAFFIVAVFVLFFICDIVKILFSSYMKRNNSPLPQSMLYIIQFILIIIGLLFIFANLGFNVTTFVAGLGIGGVAIALASQAVLGDLFNYFVILFDKPFQKGDTIQVGSNIGSVEYIGIKSTRIRSATGELLLISNTDLTKSVIRNYRVAEKRRCLVVLGVEYSTDPDKLKEIPDYVKKALGSVKNIEISRVHFSEFGASSLNFELAYFVLSADYVEYMDAVQAANYKIVEIFNEKGINFAFPSQTIYMGKA